MTDNNLNQDECTLAVKASRGHTLHQISQPNATVIAAGPHGGYSIPPDVVHHSHLSYRMLQPSFQIPHPIPLPAPLSGPNPRPGQISNDLGPPIFMPPLNLGTPKSSSITLSMPSTANKQPQGVPCSSVSSTATPTSINPSQIDGTSNVITTYSNLIPPSSGTPYHPSSILHSNQQPFNTQQPLNSTIPKIQSLSKPGLNLNSVHKISQEAEGQIKGQHNTTTNTCASNAIVKNAKHSNTNVSSISGYGPNNMIGPPTGRAGNTPQTGSINIIKHSKTPGMVELPAYITQSGLYSQIQPSNKTYAKVLKDGTVTSEPSINRNKTDINDVSGISGLGSGNVLVCTEGLPPPVPRNTVSTSSSDIKHDRSHIGNHITESHSLASLQGITVTDSQIPWPEAVSKNIIIPAPNLTGKDIANLTSATSSPIATNDRTGNDVSWLPLSDHHPDNQHSHQSSMDSLTSSSSNSNNLLGSYMTTHESAHAQTGSNLSGLGMCLVSQTTIASPRPSILRKRGYDGRPVETINSPSSPGMHKILRQRSRGSPCELTDNHFARDDILSPRKRPRKQHLYIDSINNHNFPSHNSQDDEAPSTVTEPTSRNNNNSMVANERLLGPLPLKEKKNQLLNMEEITTKIDSSNTKHETETTADIIYMSQLRRSQFPLIQLCRKNRRFARNHFRRHADIKHKEDDSIPTHELCSQSSTWLRSSGWKLQHFSSQLEKMESYESDLLVVLERLKEKCDSLLETMTDIELEEKHRKFLTETMMRNIERVRRSKLHTQETRESMMKVLDVNGKVVEIMKKFATQLPTKLLTTSTSVTDLDNNST